MTDHHDWTDHHDDSGDPAFHDEPLHFDDQQPFDDHQHTDDEPDYQPHDDTFDHHVDEQPVYEPHPPEIDDVHDVHDDPAAAATPAPDVADVEPEFPPAVDVGPLPEPVDGFPWIDTGSLGLVDADTLHTTAVDPVDPHELAEYAATDLPPGVDPWAALADSDDPATAALARWWAENQQ